MGIALAAHDALLRAAVNEAGGTVVKTTGDGMLAAFDRAEAALTAAIAGQHALDHHDWPETGRLRVRMASRQSARVVRVRRACTGDGIRAARLFGAAEILREVADASMAPAEREEYDVAIGRLGGMTSDEARRSAWAEGRGMTSDEAVAFALSR